MTNFDKIMDNANAFISAGGNAHWKMIEFEHNKHSRLKKQENKLQNGIYTFYYNIQLWWKRIRAQQTNKNVSNNATLQNYEDDTAVIEDWKINYYNNLKIRCEWKGYNAIFLATNGEIFLQD